jgi:hypothetical protein
MGSKNTQSSISTEKKNMTVIKFNFRVYLFKKPLKFLSKIVLNFCVILGSKTYNQFEANKYIFLATY